MNCREFLEEFYGRTILAFAQRETTFAFKFKAENIATFMKKYIDYQFRGWKVIYFYSIKEENGNKTEDEDVQGIMRDKAEFLYLVAKSSYQTEKQCVLKYVLSPPDMSYMQGTKIKIINLAARPAKYTGESF